MTTGCLGGPPANFKRSGEVGDREKPGKVSVVDDEPTIRRRCGEVRQGVHGRLVLGEQRDVVARDHRVPYASGSPLRPRYRGDRGEGEEADGASAVDHRVGGEPVRPGDVVHETPDR